MNEAPAHSRPTPRLWIALIWLGVGLIDASQTVLPMRAQGMHHNWMRLLVTMVIHWLPWALATPLMMRIGRQYPPSRSPQVKAVSVHLGLLGVIAVLTAAWSVALDVLLDPWGRAQPIDSYHSLWLTTLWYGLLASLILYTFIQAITFAMDSAASTARQRTKAARLSEQLAKAQLNGLRQQMNPHFMFNTLNAISGLIRDHRNDAAVSMIAGLSDLLRRAAHDADRPQVALHEELDSLNKFLEIQRIRFADRLRIVIDIPQDLHPARVPNLLLQPLVENAIKHGIAKRIEGGTIAVTGCRSAGRLRLRVYNDGPRLQSNWEANSAGIGIANLRARLQLLHGGNFELDLSSPEAGGVAVAVSLPLDVRE